MIGVLRTGTRSVRVACLDDPEPTDDQVTIAVAYAGICGTDVRDYQTRNSARHAPAGHEFSGVVLAVGALVTNIRPGDTVTAVAFAPCTYCHDCLTGSENLCKERVWLADGGSGGFASVARVKARSVVRIPEGMSLKAAALLEPLAVSIRAVNTAMSVAKSITVVGGGTVGQLCLRVASARGAVELIAVTRHGHQNTFAMRAGARAIDTSSLGSSATLSAATIVCAGGASALDIALRHTRPGGTIVLLGESDGRVYVDIDLLTSKELRIVGSNTCTHLPSRVAPSDMSVAIDTVQSGLEVESLVTHVFDIYEAGRAFMTAADKRTGSMKVMLNPSNIQPEKELARCPEV